MNRCPALQESHHLLPVISFAAFQETAVLCVQHLTLGIENHHDGETETYGIAQSVHGLLHVLVIRLAAVVDVDINVVVVH